MLKTRLLVLLPVLALAACTSQVTGRPVAVPNPTKPKPPTTIALLLPDAKDATTRSIRRGVEEYAKQHKAKLEYTATTGNPTTDAPLQSRAVAKKPTVVIFSLGAVDKFLALAMQNPKQKFLFLDNCLGGKGTPPANVTCTDSRDHEGVYLMGAEAGLLTTTGKVGAVIAMDNIPALKRFSVPFGQGAAASKPGTAYQEAVIGQGGDAFNDPVGAGRAATSLAASHVMTSAFGGNPGVFQAAKAGGFGVFGMTPEDCQAGQGVVVDSLVKHMDVVVKDSLTAIEAGRSGEARSYGFKEKALSLSSLEPDAAASACTGATKPDVVGKVGELRDKIASGEVKVTDPFRG